jgi:hypothetical protein
MLRMFPLWLVLAGLGLASLDAFHLRRAPTSPESGVVSTMCEDGTPIPPR